MFVSTKNTNDPTPNSTNPNADPNANNSNTTEEWNKQPKQKRLRLRLLVIGCIVVALVVLQLVKDSKKLSSYTTTTSSSTMTTTAAAVAAVPTSSIPTITEATSSATTTTRQTMMATQQQQQQQPNSSSTSSSSSSPLPLSKHPPLPVPVPGPPVPGPSSSSSSPPQRDTSIVADGVEDQERSSNNNDNNNNDQKDPQQPQPQTKVMNDKSSPKIKNKNTNDTNTITSNNNDNTDCSMSSSSSPSYNSKEWLQGPRLGNIQMPDDDDNDDDDDDDDASSSSWMLDLLTPVVASDNNNNNNNNGDILTKNIQQLLKQTICHETSNFVDLKDEEQQQEQQQATNKDTEDVDDIDNAEDDDDDDDDDPLVIQMWTIRFIYLAVYHHQHRHAIPEYHERKRRRQEERKKNSTCRTDDQYDDGVGNFDYECKDAKFLVVPLSNHGLGSVLRLGATNAILTGLALNRTVLFVNGVDRPMPPSSEQQQQPMNNGKNDEFLSLLTTSWKLVSCPRKDYQCFFQPITPCVISQQEYQSAPMILHPNNRGPLHTLFDYDHTRIYEKERVVLLKLGDVNGVAWSRQSIVLQQLATEILQSLVIDVNPNDPRIPLFQKAIDAIQPDDQLLKGEEEDYPGSTSIIKRAILFYLLRPNPEHAEKLRNIMIPIQQQHQQHNRLTLPRPTTSTTTTTDTRPVTFGLPIRASDKCNNESECLSFVQYMKLLYETLKNGFLDNNSNHNHRAAAAAGRPQSQQLPSPPPPPIINILLTSESQSVFDEKELFLQNFTHHHHHQQDAALLNYNDHSSYDYDYSSSSFIDSIRFISNDNDIRQGSGAVGHPSKKYIKKLNITADDILLSAISSIQTQLLGSQYTIGNCCSNFHNLIFEFLRGGCGNAIVKMVKESEEEEGDGNTGGKTKPRKKKKMRRRTVTTTQCLQNHPNPEFVVCCWPRKRPACPRIRLERLAEYKLNHSSSWSIV